ncbi:hypothetical protein SAMN05421820_102175 [Pedobacter steynii]|uniref:Uncharacterized protein n=1 Tax=Pedobacter steynii TaxID=430522 RepID=A0A1G9N1X0_9SPHI|nr:hypothetical protein SAMN05421820_102175 [Pedobacter steynii]
MRNAIVCVLIHIFSFAVFGYYFTKIVIDDNKEGDEK